MLSTLFVICLLGTFHGSSSCASKPLPKYNVIMLGNKGTGKSTMANVLLGYKGYNKHPSSPGNGCFEETSSVTQHSFTVEPCKISGNLFYYESVMISVIDTPGFESDGGSYMKNIAKTEKFLTKDVGEATVFVVMLKYTNFDWDLAASGILMYELFFGEEFWKQAVFVVNFNPSYNLNNKFAQDYWKKEINNILKPSIKLNIVFANPFAETGTFRMQIGPIIDLLNGKKIVKLYNVKALLAEVSKLKEDVKAAIAKSREIEISTKKQITTTTERALITTTKTPLLCGNNHPLVVKGVTLYPDTVIYEFMDVMYAGMVGFGGSVCVLLILVLFFNVCLKKSNNTKRFPGQKPPKKSARLQCKLYSRVLDKIVEGNQDIEKCDTESIMTQDITLQDIVIRKDNMENKNPSIDVSNSNFC